MNYWTQSEKNIYVAAHRGCSTKYPENTMAAFRAAVEAEVDQIEIDVHETKDGELVIIHDDKVDRTTDGKGKVIRNASRRLVGAFEGKPWFVPGQSMFLITYKGKKKFNNGNTGDDWSIQELRLKQPNPNANTQGDVEL